MMTRIKFIEHDGAEHVIEAEPGQSVMQAATFHGIPGILADCGGNCACATCHVYVDPAWRSRAGEPSKTEREMIDCALDVKEESRLCCQIRVSAELDGLVVRLPQSQT
jgi:ferredoxin, 2Fe-2S